MALRNQLITGFTILITSIPAFAGFAGYDKSPSPEEHTFRSGIFSGGIGISSGLKPYILSTDTNTNSIK